MAAVARLKHILGVVDATELLALAQHSGIVHRLAFVMEVDSVTLLSCLPGSLGSPLWLQAVEEHMEIEGSVRAWQAHLLHQRPGKLTMGQVCMKIAQP